MEELGDARMRCDQLVRYVDNARKLVEKSSHRDHIFEVAGHLLQAIPSTLFRLEKALQAVALAATRIDYEELKQALRPEKVEELEDVLEDVRIRSVRRRGDPSVLQWKAPSVTSVSKKARTLPGWLFVKSLKHAFVAWEQGRHYDALEQMADWMGSLKDAPEGVFDTKVVRDGVALAQRARTLSKAVLDFMIDAENLFYSVEKSAEQAEGK